MDSPLSVHPRVECLRGPNHGVVREFDSDRKETHSAQAEAKAGSIAFVASNASKYRLLERYVARNVNDKK
jgi:hypothetical protein